MRFRERREGRWGGAVIIDTSVSEKTEELVEPVLRGIGQGGNSGKGEQFTKLVELRVCSCGDAKLSRDFGSAVTCGGEIVNETVGGGGEGHHVVRDSQSSGK